MRRKNQIVEPICNIVFFKIKGKIYLVGELCKCQYHIIPKKGGLYEMNGGQPLCLRIRLLNERRATNISTTKAIAC